MSTIELETKIRKMQEWEALAEEAKAEAESLRDEIKAEMLNRNTEELTAGLGSKATSAPSPAPATGD